MKWVRPEDVYIPRCAYRWWCSSCGGKVNYNHGANARKVKGRLKCEYVYCPWCGEKNEEIEHGNNDD